MTRAGIVLGTAAHMSPEQARGLAVDTRTDVWAFGALLYEMLAGARPFPGSTITDTLAQILERDPDWSKLPATTPGTVRALIQRCLRKEPKQRLHEIADARFVLEDALATCRTHRPAQALTRARRARSARRGEPRPLLRTKASERLPYLSPDERWMASVSDEGGRDEVWVRAFPDGAAAIQVSQDGGTEPVWAPDGTTLYYCDRTGSRLHAVPVTAGGVPQFGTPVVTTGYWKPGEPFGRQYDLTPDGRALLLVPEQTLGREIRVVLNFDEVIRTKMAGGQVAAECGRVETSSRASSVLTL